MAANERQWEPMGANGSQDPRNRGSTQPMNQRHAIVFLYWEQICHLDRFLLAVALLCAMPSPNKVVTRQRHCRGKGLRWQSCCQCREAMAGTHLSNSKAQSASWGVVIQESIVFLPWERDPHRDRLLSAPALFSFHRDKGRPSVPAVGA